MKRALCLIAAALFCSVMVHGVPMAHSDPVDEYVHQQMQKQHIPGLSLVIIRDGNTIKAKGYGYANVELSVSATPSTVYEIGSITKQFTATAVMMLAEEGKIGLDDRIAKYLVGLPDGWKEVTVRQLLTHISGIKDFTGVAGFEKMTLMPATHAEVIKTVASYPLEFPSGDQWAYSNTGYYLLGMILEKVSGESYSALLQERIFKPLQMNATQVYDLHSIIPNRASGYEWHEGALRAADNVSMTWPFAAGAIVSTVNDLAKWDAALDTDRVLKKSSRQQMLTPVKLNSGIVSPYGFGWFVDKKNGHTLYSHPGSISGFSSQIIRFPDDRLTIILLSNQMVDLAAVSHSIAAMYVPAFAPPTYKPIADKEPQVTAQIKRIIQQSAEGKLDSNLFTSELAATMSADLAHGAAAALQQMGPLQSIVLVERKNDGQNRVYRYRLAYRRAMLATVCTFNKDNKISAMSLQP